MLVAVVVVVPVAVAAVSAAPAAAAPARVDVDDVTQDDELGSWFGELGGADEADDEADDNEDECADEPAELDEETFLAVSAALFRTMRFMLDTEGKLSSSQIPSNCN